MRDRQKTARRVLVTGGAGFIGANEVRDLLARNYAVTVLDDLRSGRADYLQGLPVRLIEGDVLDAGLLNEVVSTHDAVIHLAAEASVPLSLAAPRRGCEVNVLGTLNVLEALRRETEERGGRALRLVYASSNAALGRQPPPASEEKAPLPISPYGASKSAAEAYCLAYYGSWKVQTVVLRLGNVYGPFSRHTDGVVAKFLKDSLETSQITLEGNGSQTRDFVYVGDVCRAIWMALESKACGEVFQVASGTETTIEQLVALLQEIVGEKFAVAHASARPGDIHKNYSATGKIAQMLGWRAQVGLREGLVLTHRWYCEQGSTAAQRHPRLERQK